jgi:hypothetical protein
VNPDDMSHFDAIDSPFQVQEYIATLVRDNPHDVSRIVERPGPCPNKGKGKAVDSEGVVDSDVWLYEQLR